MKCNRPLTVAFLLAVALAFMAPASGAGAARSTREAIPGGQLLTVLSCSSAQSCWALDFNATVAAHWDGTQWTSMPLSLPSVTISALTCLSDRDCWAVGSSSPTGNVIVHWNGHIWSTVRAPHPKNDDPHLPQGTVHLTGVTCASRTSCWAAGEYWANRGSFRGHWFIQILRWDGGAWKQVPAPQAGGRATGSIRPRVTSLACAGARVCWAVGDYAPTHGGESQALMLGWNGGRWSIVRNPLHSSSAGATLGAITCPSAVRCIMVGGSGETSPRALLWNGKTWTSISSATIGALQAPKDAVNISLSSVSCDSANDCWVLANWVGYGF